MLFKSGKPSGGITIISLGSSKKPEPMPEPEVGKIYHGFDDGKIKLSRLIDWKIVKRIDLDNDKVSKNLLRVLQKEIKELQAWIDYLEIENYKHDGRY